MQAIKLRIDDIVVSDRLRNVSQATVDEIAASFAEVGQLSPIIVWRNTSGSYVLAAGEHRLAAAIKAKWSHIDAYRMPTSAWGDDEWHAAQARKIEVDENMQRKNLDYAETVLFRAERVAIVDREHAWLAPKIEEAEAENLARDKKAHEARQAAAAEALARAEAEKDAKAKAAVEREQKELAAEAARLAREAELQSDRKYNRTKREGRSDPAKSKPVGAYLTGSRSDPAKSKPVGAYLTGSRATSPEEMPERVSGEHGLTAAAYTAANRYGGNPITLRDAFQRVQAAGGAELVKSLTGTSLATRAEMTSLSTLQREFPDAARRLLKQAKAGANVSAQATLGGLVKERNELQRAEDRKAWKGHREKAAAHARRDLSAVRAAIEKLKSTLRDGDLTEDLQVATRITVQLTEMDARLDQYRNVATARPNGTEYKYGIDATPAATAARAKAKQQQTANGKLSAKTLKTK